MVTSENELKWRNLFIIYQLQLNFMAKLLNQKQHKDWFRRFKAGDLKETLDEKAAQTQKTTRRTTKSIS